MEYASCFLNRLKKPVIFDITDNSERESDEQLYLSGVNIALSLLNTLIHRFILIRYGLFFAYRLKIHVNRRRLTDILKTIIKTGISRNERIMINESTNPEFRARHTHGRSDLRTS